MSTEEVIKLSEGTKVQIRAIDGASKLLLSIEMEGLDLDIELAPDEAKELSAMLWRVRLEATLEAGRAQMGPEEEVLSVGVCPCGVPVSEHRVTRAHFEAQRVLLGTMPEAATDGTKPKL